MNKFGKAEHILPPLVLDRTTSDRIAADLNYRQTDAAVIIDCLQELCRCRYRMFRCSGLLLRHGMVISRKLIPTYTSSVRNLEKGGTCVTYGHDVCGRL